MSQGLLAKVAAKTAAEVCARLELGADARKLLQAGQTPRQFLDRLLEQQRYSDAAGFLAHGLPKREAVWWGCLCVQQIVGPNSPGPMIAALDAAKKWVSDPSEENRRAAFTAAEAADFGNPAGCVGLAAFFSGGSL